MHTYLYTLTQEWITSLRVFFVTFSTLSLSLSLSPFSLFNPYDSNPFTFIVVFVSVSKSILFSQVDNFYDEHIKEFVVNFLAKKNIFSLVVCLCAQISYINLILLILYWTSFIICSKQFLHRINECSFSLTNKRNLRTHEIGVFCCVKTERLLFYMCYFAHCGRFDRLFI